jgi:hypothetical protein
MRARRLYGVFSYGRQWWSRPLGWAARSAVAAEGQVVAQIWLTSTGSSFLASSSCSGKASGAAVGQDARRLRWVARRLWPVGAGERRRGGFHSS